MNIDWYKVREARRRGKMGIMQPGDQELCEAAMKADPERYAKLSREVIQEVTEEMQSMFDPVTRKMKTTFSSGDVSEAIEAGLEGKPCPPLRRKS